MSLQKSALNLYGAKNFSIMTKLKHKFSKKSKLYFLPHRLIAKYHNVMKIPSDHDNKMALAKRVKEAIASLGRGGKRDIARKCHITDQAITGWLKTGNISTDNLLIVANMTGYNWEWLITGKGQKHKEKISMETAQDQTDLAGKLIPYPYKNITIMGSIHFQNHSEWAYMGHLDNTTHHVIFPSIDKDVYAIRCTGDHMRPRIQDGEYIIVEPNSEVIPGDEVLAINHDGLMMIKKFLYEREGRVHLMSLNESEPSKSIARADIKSIHYIAAIVKRAKWLPPQ